MNDKTYPSMVIRSQAEAIELLKKENKQLKEENTKLNIKLEDRAYEELKVAYEKAKEENQELKEMHKTMARYALDNEAKIDLYKSVLDEIKEYIEKHKMIDYDEFEYISTSPDTMLQILDKAKESK